MTGIARNYLSITRQLNSNKAISGACTLLLLQQSPFYPGAVGVNSLPYAVMFVAGNCNADHYCVVCVTGQKLDEDKQDGVPEVFIDQDEVLAKVCIVV